MERKRQTLRGTQRKREGQADKENDREHRERATNLAYLSISLARTPRMVVGGARVFSPKAEVGSLSAGMERETGREGGAGGRGR